MTRRLERSFRNMSKNSTFLEKMTRRIDFLKNINQGKETFLMTQRIEPFFVKNQLWPTELNHFLHMSHRIEPFFPTWLIKNWTLLFNMTQRIEPDFQNLTQRIEPFSLHKRTQRIGPWKIIWLQQPNFFDDSRNWTLFSTESKTWAFSQKYHSNY